MNFIFSEKYTSFGANHNKALHRLTIFNFPSTGSITPAENAAHCLCAIRVCLQQLCYMITTVTKETVEVYLFVIAGQALVV